MTFATSDPVDWLCDAADEKIGDLSDNVNELRAGLTALCDGNDRRKAKASCTTVFPRCSRCTTALQSE